MGPSVGTINHDVYTSIDYAFPVQLPAIAGPPPASDKKTNPMVYPAITTCEVQRIRYSRMCTFSTSGDLVNKVTLQ